VAFRRVEDYAPYDNSERREMRAFVAFRRVEDYAPYDIRGAGGYVPYELITLLLIAILLI